MVFSSSPLEKDMYKEMTRGFGVKKVRRVRGGHGSNKVGFKIWNPSLMQESLATIFTSPILFLRLTTSSFYFIKKSSSLY